MAKRFSPTPPIPDLVRDSNLQTSFHLDCTIHSYTEFDRTRRRTIRQEYWKSKRRLGQGSYGQVWLEECTEGKSQGALRAVKIIHKAPDTNTRDYLRELEAVAKFSHPRYEACFTKSFGWYENIEAIYISMEYCPLGDLYHYLSSVPSLPVVEVQELTRQILEGLYEMHENGFAHRDLKPKNILIKSQPPEIWWVKLADFGISKRNTDQNSASKIRGTEQYMAPELLFSSGKYLESYNYQAADMWAVGEIAFQMLTGEHTFQHQGMLIDYYREVQEYPKARLKPLAGDDGTTLISRLMDKDPHLRTSATVALRHPWIRSDDNDSEQHNFHSTILKVGDSPLVQGRFFRGNDTGTVQQPSASWSTVSDAKMINLDTNSSVIRSSSPASIPHQELPVRSKPISPEGMKSKLRKFLHLPIQGFASSFKTDEQSNSFPSVHDRHSKPDSSFISEYEVFQSWEEPTMKPLERPNLASTKSGGAAFDGDWEMLRAHQSHELSVHSVAFSSDSKLIATGSRDTTVKIWDVGSGALLQTLRGHPAFVNDVAFFPNNERVFATTYLGAEPDHDPPREINIWSLNSGKIVQTFKLEAKSSVHYSRNGKLLALCLDKHRVTLWDTSSAVPNITLTDSTQILTIEVSEDGNLVATLMKDNRIIIWDAHSGAKLHTISNQSEPWCLAFSPHNSKQMAWAFDNTIRVWDTDLGVVSHVLKGHRGTVHTVRFSPNGKLLVSQSFMKEIKLWDADSGALLYTFNEDEAYPWIIFSSDSKLLATVINISESLGPEECTIKLRDSSTGVMLQTLRLPDHIHDIAFSPDGKLLVMGCKDGITRIWGRRKEGVLSVSPT